MKLLQGYSLYTLWKTLGALNYREATENPAEARLVIDGQARVIPLTLKYDKETGEVYFVERKPKESE